LYSWIFASLNKGGNSKKKLKKEEEPNLRLNECQLVILTKKKQLLDKRTWRWNNTKTSAVLA
jgi:hypothetical protein